MKPIHPFRQMMMSAEAGTVSTGTLAAMVLMLLVLGGVALMALNPPALLTELGMIFIAPHLLVVVSILGATLYVAFSKTHQERQNTWWIALLGSLGAFLVLLVFGMRGIVSDEAVFFSMFRPDLFSLLINVLLTLGTILTLLFCREYLDQRIQVPGEFYIMILTALLGGMFLSGAADLIMLFVALETLSISSYVITGFLRQEATSQEAALKFLLYGGMATAILLFGFSLMYGLTHTTQLEPIYLRIADQIQAYPLVGSIMTIMILGGFAFKLSAAPFHMWTPDVYEGAPTPVTAFLSVVSKIAAMSIVIRFFYVIAGAMPGWIAVLSVLSVLSMVLGNVLAVVQRNIKRLLAYSTIAHMGYILLGLVILSPANLTASIDGLSSVMYYLMAYLFMNLGAFAVVVYFANLTGSETIADYAGLVRAHPALTAIFSVLLLSLAGIPITAGFFGKFFLFWAVIEAGPQYLWLVIVALLTSTIALYYYLNIIRLMVVAEPSAVVQQLPPEPPAGNLRLSPMFLMLGICVIATLWMGLMADPFLQIGKYSINSLFEQNLMASEAMHVADAVAAK